MSMSGGGDGEEPIVGINVTPLVDVCLVLVIIFMVTAPMMSEPLFKIDLPEARSGEGREEEKIVVTISPEKYAVKHREYKKMDRALMRLKRDIRRSRGKVVILKADKTVYHGVLVEFMHRAKEYGARSLTIATVRKKA